MLASQLCPFDVSSLSPFTTQAELAEIIDISPATLFRYRAMAKILIPDFRKYHEERIPLNRYQCWVLIRIHDAFRVFKNKAYITKHLKENSNQFSKYMFTKSTGVNL
jgi:hypothetical protein